MQMTLLTFIFGSFRLPLFPKANNNKGFFYAFILSMAGGPSCKGMANYDQTWRKRKEWAIILGPLVGETRRGGVERPFPHVFVTSFRMILKWPKLQTAMKEKFFLKKSGCHRFHPKNFEQQPWKLVLFFAQKLSCQAGKTVGKKEMRQLQASSSGDREGFPPPHNIPASYPPTNNFVCFINLLC